MCTTIRLRLVFINKPPDAKITIPPVESSHMSDGMRVNPRRQTKLLISIVVGPQLSNPYQVSVSFSPTYTHAQIKHGVGSCRVGMCLLTTWFYFFVLVSVLPVSSLNFMLCFSSRSQSKLMNMILIYWCCCAINGIGLSSRF